MKTHFFWLLVIITLIPKLVCQVNLQYQACGREYRCGNATFSYPFWGGTDRPEYCGHPYFEVSCPANNPMIVFSNVTYRILQSPDNASHTFRIAREDLYNANCPSSLSNLNRDTVFNFKIFNYSDTQNLTIFFGCNLVSPPPLLIPFVFNCTFYRTPTTNYFIQDYNATQSSVLGNPDLSSCSRNLTVPIYSLHWGPSFEAGTSNFFLRHFLKSGFNLKYKAYGKKCADCSRSKGRCGYNNTSNSFICYCSDHPYDHRCGSSATPTNSSGRSTRLTIGLPVGIAALILMASLSLMIYYLDKRYSCMEKITSWRSDEGSNQLVEEFMRTYGSTAPKLYTYSEVRKMTNSFSKKIGHGGFGCVYRGKLPDGREVAVKVLDDSRGNGEDFINEVAAISQTSHVNVVTLLGFSYNKKKRALIYEFMPNGSLDTCIGEKGSRHLEWSLLYTIVVGIARGLEYLHRGCNTRIVHLDIKPQNILLDKDFCPKICDFGLAKLCKQKQSVLSTMGARGTIGYIAPEVFCRSFGGISHKSDVYSYGMMVLEMVGLTREVDIDLQQTSESYFPDWIYEHFELGKDLPLEGVTNEGEKEDTMKMTFVGLWCIQTNPSDRPSMSKVVEMLEGNLESLQIPPKPILTSSRYTSFRQESLKTSSISS